MLKDNRIYIDHILVSAHRIQSFVSEMDYDQFASDVKTQDAVIRNFEIIGEATKRISPDFRNKYSEIPWSDMAGMRDRLIHDYLEVDLEIVWKTATEDLPPLVTLIERI
ncbi:MAG: DUF86 domain-containing protein [Bacteroidales bacterium]|nr:DUF86 domain-containing protein [Bacteroidota bacterium]MBL6949646.1 DUF86 domain-containing protein [Bacteroidales bacterium]